MADKKILLICESPNKILTLKGFLPSNYTVMASVGHITKIADSGLYNMGIDVANHFTPDIVVDAAKKDVVKQLKEQIKLSDFVYLGTDGDREGEAIAYYLKTVLKIPDSKYKRIVYHEITKSAVTKAIENARTIDNNMAQAAITRAILDKIVGYRVSPIALTKVGCKSVGRVQSAALKILALRENEIINFNPETYYEIWLPFKKNKKVFRAQYKGTDTKKLVTIKDKKIADKIISECKPGNYIVKNITSKDRNIQSKPPFTTSTFQQEVSSKLGYSTKKAMECAQKLFEGISIAGQHVGLITYIRTDSTDMADEFVESLNDFVQKTYGKKYYAPVKKAKKSKNVQDGHEALRVVDLTMTPEKLKSYVNDTQLLKVYKIIYDRTVASAMSDCIMTDTEYSIYNNKHRFALSTHAVKFDGFKAVYGYSEEEEDDNKDPQLVIDEKIKDDEIELIQKDTTPPSRYTEASLIKKMEETGIGRPSTFASTLTTIQDPGRGYVELEGKSLKVTEKGLRLSKFLDSSFGDIINLTYTSEMEENLDKIADGKINYESFLSEFYNKLCEEIKLAKQAESDKPAAVKIDRKCPNCGKDLVIRKGRYGDFIACSGFPKCKYTEKIGGEPKKEDDKKDKTLPEDTGFKCPNCGGKILKRFNKTTNMYWYACGNYPKHKQTWTPEAFIKIAESQAIDNKTKDKI